MVSVPWGGQALPMSYRYATSPDAPRTIAKWDKGLASRRSRTAEAAHSERVAPASAASSVARIAIAAGRMERPRYGPAGL